MAGISLNQRQDLFVTHYLANGMNATQAYRDAYDAHDRPDSSVNPSASRLLRHERVRQAIVTKKQGLIHKIEAKQDITRDFLIIEYLDVLAKSKEQSSTLSVGKSCLDSLAHISGIWQDKKQLQVTGAINHLANLDTGTLIDALSVATTSAIKPGDESDAEPVAIDGDYRKLADA